MSTLSNLSRTFVKGIVPAAFTRAVQTYLLKSRARRLQEGAAHLSSVDDVVETAFAYGCFQPNQIRSEVTQLLEVLAARKPRRIMEIGSQGGGNLFLLSKVAAPDAKILSIDLNYSPVQMAAYPLLAAPTQTLTCLQADSSAPDTVRRVKEWLGADRLDFLFIDGDHRLAGVTADYQLYSPLVAPGGLIGFHDIVADFNTRFGRKTLADAGDVPLLWNQLKTRHDGCREFVDDPAQDGAGIGLMSWSG